MEGVSLLPEEFTSAQERTGGFLPTDDRAPLVVFYREIIVRVDDIFEVVAEESFTGGSYDHLFSELFVSTSCDNCTFWSKAGDVIFFFLKKRHWDKRGKIDISDSNRFDFLVEIALNLFPKGIAIGAVIDKSFGVSIAHELCF